ncbi:MAG: hypothetical protein QXN45_02335, partial [Candidatus Thermoplasmatota archaeon]
NILHQWKRHRIKKLMEYRDAKPFCYFNYEFGEEKAKTNLFFISNEKRGDAENNFMVKTKLLILS